MRWQTRGKAFFRRSTQIPCVAYRAESQVRPQVEEGNHGKIVAIDIETGGFEIDSSEIAACDRLEARHSDTQVWMVRIGSRYVRRFGGRTKRAI